jgi:hypothetical protein
VRSHSHSGIRRLFGPKLQRAIRVATLMEFSLPERGGDVSSLLERRTLMKAHAVCLILCLAVSVIAATEALGQSRGIATVIVDRYADLGPLSYRLQVGGLGIGLLRTGDGFHLDCRMPEVETPTHVHYSSQVSQDHRSKNRSSQPGQIRTAFVDHRTDLE